MICQIIPLRAMLTRKYVKQIHRTERVLEKIFVQIWKVYFKFVAHSFI